MNTMTAAFAAVGMTDTSQPAPPVVAVPPADQSNVESSPPTAAQVAASQPDPQPAQQPAQPDNVSNQPADATKDKKKFFELIRNYGKAEGQGAGARPAMARQVVEAAHNGALVEDDAEAIVSNYAEGQAKAKGIGVVKMGSLSQQASKVRTFIKLGLLPNVDGPAVMDRVGHAVVEARKAAGDKPLAKSPYDIYLSAARYQIDFPDVEIDDATIQACLLPPARSEKGEADKLDAVLNSMDKLYTGEDAPLSDESKAILEQVMPLFGDRIKALGGTTADRKRAAKAEEKLAKAQAKVAALTDKMRPGPVARYVGNHPVS